MSTGERNMRVIAATVCLIASLVAGCVLILDGQYWWTVWPILLSCMFAGVVQDKDKKEDADA